MLSHAKRFAYGAVSKFLRALIRLTATRSPRLRGPLHYLDTLVSQGRYGEFNALIAHGIGRLAGKLRPGPAGGADRGKQHAFRAIRIDAATRRLSIDGKPIEKDYIYSFPDSGAKTLVSIIITCRNHGEYLPDTLVAARAQTLVSRDIIIIDDGSTEPETVGLLDRFRTENDLIVLRQAEQDIPNVRDIGIRQAQGEFICCLDAGDLIDPTYLECAIARLLADRSTGFVYPYVRVLGEAVEVRHTEDFDIDRAILGNFTAVSAVFRRDDWDQIGACSAGMRDPSEDRAFWVRLASLGRRGHVIQRPLVAHRRPDRTLTNDAKEMHEELPSPTPAFIPRAFAEPSFRQLLKRIAPPERPDANPFTKLKQAIARPEKPGLLVVVPWLRRGGAEVLLLSLLRGLSQQWHIVLATTEDDPHLMHDEFAAVVPEIFHLTAILEQADRTAFLAYLVDTRAVTHCLSSQSAWHLAQLPELKKQFPHLRTANILHNHVPDRVFRAALGAGSALDRHLAVSGAVVDTLKASGIPETRIKEIANGIDVEPGAGAAKHRSATRAELGVPDDARLLLWVGRFGEEKRPGLFVEIVASLSADPSLQAIMAGEGPLEASVDSAIRHFGMATRIQRLGHRDRGEITRLMAAADILVLTSTVEGMPLTVLEALAAGCPVASVDVGDVARVIKPGFNGILMEPSRALDLASAIEAAWPILTGEAARAAIRKDFSTRSHTEPAMVRAYSEALAAL